MNKKALSLVLFFLYLSAISTIWLIGVLQGMDNPSVPKTLLAIAVTVLTLASCCGFLMALLRSNFRHRSLAALDNLAMRPRLYWALVALTVAVFALSGYAALSSSVQALLGSYRIYFTPIARFLAAASGGLIAFLLLQRAHWPAAARWKAEMRLALFGFLLMLVVWGGIVISRIGLAHDIAWWSEPGTPILMWQVFLAWLIACLALIIETNPPSWLSKISPRTSDIFICLFLWIITFVSWQSAPLRQDHFIAQPLPPNYEYYPYSDARLYDLSAQQLLVGEGLSRNPATKPLYAAFLALARSVSGQDYAKTITVQTAVLAVIPLLIFLLTKSLSNRPAGLAAALLVILRERNSILLTDVIKVSTSKMLMTDVPAMAAMLVITLLTVVWTQRPEKRPFLPMLIGGAMGMFSLLRGQILLLIPLALLFVIFVFRRHPRLLRSAIPVFLVGVALSLLPWLAWKDWTTGQVGLREAMPHETNVAYKYTLQDTRCEPEISLQECNARARNMLIHFVLSRPTDVVSFVTAHFFHNVIESVIYLPPSLRIEPLEELVTRHPAWVYRWNGDLPVETVLLLGINLALMSMGIAAAWSKAKTAALAPIILSLGYILTVSVARISGYRFILPVDWVSLVFYSIGIVQVTVILAAVLRLHIAEPGSVEPPVRLDAKPRWRSLILAVIGVLAVGLLLPLAEMTIPQKYPALRSKEQAIALYRDVLMQEKTPDLPSPEEISAFLDQDDSILLYGTALYPRYIRSGAKGSEPAVSWLSKQDYLVFYIVGPKTSAVILPLNSKPRLFPHASEVILAGCQRTGELFEGRQYIEARFVLLPQADVWFLAPAAGKDLSCPAR